MLIGDVSDIRIHRYADVGADLDVAIRLTCVGDGNANMGISSDTGYPVTIVTNTRRGSQVKGKGKGQRPTNVVGGTVVVVFTVYTLWDLPPPRKVGNAYILRRELPPEISYSYILVGNV